MPLKLGMFLTPASNPARPMAEIIDWNIDVIRAAEQLGYDEVWIGSHLTSHYSRDRVSDPDHRSCDSAKPAGSGSAPASRCSTRTTR